MTSAALARVASRPPLPEIPRRLRLGMPQLDAGGLSENWLFRHAGDLQWQAIAQRLCADTDQILGSDGDRLYPTVVAARARYQKPLAAARENDVLESSVEVVPCGRSCAHGRVQVGLPARGASFSIELLTTFAARDAHGVLRMALPAARLVERWTALESTPEIASLAKAARRGEPLVGDDFSGPKLDLGIPPLGRVGYEPSPYADYNGARLLYFPSYVTIADSAERKLVHTLGLRPPAVRDLDWALASSPVRRDVFYYANLPLGETVDAELLAFATDDGSDERAKAAPRAVKTRVRLRRASTGQPLADVITRRALLTAGGPGEAA